MKVCNKCGEEFIANRNYQKFCSAKCRRKSQRDNCKNGIKSKELVLDDSANAGLTRSMAIMQGKIERKKIMSCSVECLMNELGDIE